MPALLPNSGISFFRHALTAPFKAGSPRLFKSKLSYRETIFMTPASSHGAAAPLMGTAGVRNLFFPGIGEESEGRGPDAEPPTTRFAQLAVSGRPTPAALLQSLTWPCNCLMRVAGHSPRPCLDLIVESCSTLQVSCYVRLGSSALQQALCSRGVAACRGE